MITAQKIDVTSSTIFRAILILVSFWFLYLIWDVLLMIFAAVVVASAVEPVANYLQRYRIPRAAAVVIVYLIALLVISGMVALMVDPLTQQFRQLVQAVPGLLATAEEYLVLGPDADHQQIASSVQDALTRFGRTAVNASVNVFQGAGTFLSNIVLALLVFVLAFYLVVERDSLKKFARVVTPRDHLPYVEQAIVRAQRGVGRWVLAQLTLGVIVGTIVGIGLWILDVPYALLLGLLAGIFEIIPVIGPILAAIPGVLVGFTLSPIMGTIVLVFYVLTQQFENHVLVPNIMRRAVGLHPLVTIIAVLLGARLAGVAGAILAVPLATVLSIVLSDIFANATAEDELAG